MNSAYDIIPSDSLVQLMNSSYELDQMTHKWMFGDEEQQQGQSNQEHTQNQKKTPKTQSNEQIIRTNQDLFNVNFSKSVYVNKINSLIDVNFANQDLSNAIKKEQKIYLKTKKKFGQIYENEVEDQECGDSNKVKLAKNRQSARDSRKRKKIYVELLEVKVAELSKQIEILQKTIEQQNNFISHCVKIPSLISDFNIGYQNQLQQLNQSLTKKSLQQLDEEFGASSQKRECLCNVVFNTLVDHILPFDLKKILEHATNNLSIFKQGEIQEIKSLSLYKQQLIQQFNKFELTVFDLAKSYEYVKKEAQQLEKIKQQLTQLIGPQKYAKSVIEFQSTQQITVKEEEMNLEKMNQL